MSISLSKFTLFALLGSLAAADDGTTTDHSDIQVPLPSSCDLTVELPTPEDYTSQDYKELVKQQFLYLKQCSASDEVSFAEGAKLLRNLMEQQENDKISYEHLVKTFIALDLNSDERLTLKEILQYVRSLREPIDLGDNVAPYAGISDQLFEYMDYEVMPDVQGLNYDGYITKENLKAMQPILFPNDQANDELIIREMRLRDYDRDGKIDMHEHISYIYNHDKMRRFWNFVKGYEAERIIDADDRISKEEFMIDENPWVRREPEYYDKEVPIPEWKNEQFFYYFDMNYDGSLSFEEVWRRTQEDDMQWRHFHKYLLHPIDTNNDLQLTMEEIRAYLKQQDPTLTDEDLDISAEALMKELSMDDDLDLDRWEAWRKYHWMHDHLMRRIRDDENHERDFANGWFTIDLNRDRAITAAEFLASEHQYAQEIMDFFEVADGDSLSYEQVYTWVRDVQRPIMDRVVEPLWRHVFDRDDQDGVAYLDQFLSDEKNFEALWEVLDKWEDEDTDKLEFARELFNAIDGYLKDPDGKITRLDVCRYYFEGDHQFICGADEEETDEDKAKVEAQNAVEVAEEIFEKVDTDASGEIGKQEFVEVYQEITEKVRDDTVDKIATIPVSDLVEGLKDQLTDLIKQIIA